MVNQQEILNTLILNYLVVQAISLLIWVLLYRHIYKRNKKAFAPILMLHALAYALLQIKHWQKLLEQPEFHIGGISFKGVDLFPAAHAVEKTEAPAYGLVPLNEDGSITVRLSQLEELDVNIRSISTSDELEVEITGIDTNDELDVNIDEVGGGFLTMGGPIPVKVKN